MDVNIEKEQIKQSIPLIISEIEKVIKGKSQQIKLVLTTLFAGGHILLEDNPGTGKTVLARTIAALIKEETDFPTFKRIQFTPDLLPMDLIGTQIFDEKRQDFIFKKGPLFTHILLADEINRASPKVQSALLECMAEGQITISDNTYKLKAPFFNMATQNPLGMEGTYPLPTPQLDRFFMKVQFGYVDQDTEFDILSNYAVINHNLLNTPKILTLEEVVQIQAFSESVFVHPAIVKAVTNIIRATRNIEFFTLGASTRAGIAFIKCLKAYAMINGRDFVVDNDIKDLYLPVIWHRLIIRNQEKANAFLQQEVNNQIDILKKVIV